MGLDNPIEWATLSSAYLSNKQKNTLEGILPIFGVSI